MRTATKARIAGAICVGALALGIYTSVTAFNYHFPAAAEAAKINLQLKSQEMDVSGLDSKIAAYWTAIQDASMAGKFEIPNSPQAYCQNLPVATSQLESNVNKLLCSSLETRAQTSEALPALQAQAQAANEKASHEHNFWYRWRVLPMSGSIIVSFFAGYSWFELSRQEREGRNSLQSPASPT